MKVYDYIIVFKKRSDRLTDSISQLMLLLAVCVFIFSLSVSTATKTAIPLIVVTLGIIGWWIYLYQKQKKGKTPYYRVALLLAACGWYLQPGALWIALVYLLAALLEKQVKFPQELAFDAEEIVFNTFPKKTYRWEELANVILKDGILTVDFRNNKLIQKEIESQATAADERDFNEFCQSKLKARA